MDKIQRLSCNFQVLQLLVWEFYGEVSKRNEETAWQEGRVAGMAPEVESYLAAQDPWHPSSRAAGTIQAGLGHLPRIAEPSLIHMPLILGRRDPQASVCVRPLSLPARREDYTLWFTRTPMPFC